MASPAEIFCSYASADETLLQQLEQHLASLRHAGRLLLRHRGQIAPGDNVETTLEKWQAQASAILLLVSPAFLSSDVCYQEAQQAVQRLSARVIPVILRPCDWSTSPFAGFQCLPHSQRAITSSSNQDEAWQEVTEGILRVLETLSAPDTPSPAFHFVDKQTAPSGAQETATPPEQPEHRLIQLPRRTTFLIGIGLASSLVVGGATAWFWRFAHQMPLYSCRGHTNVVETVAWSPDGTRLASGSWDTSVRIWDASNGNQLVLCQKHTDQVFGVAWSPDSKYLVSGSKDMKVYIWDAILGGAPLITYQGHAGQVFAVAWSPDGKRIASGGKEATIHVWDAKTGQRLRTYPGHTDIIRHLAWSSDNRHLASGSEDTTVRVWDTEQDVGIYTYAGHSNWVVCLDWEPKGRRVASGSRDNNVHVWDAFGATPSQVYSRHTGEVEAVAWKPGKTDPEIASGSEDKTVQIWRVADQTLLQTISVSYEAESVAWAPNGTHLAIASADKNIHIEKTTNLQVWTINEKF